MLVLGQQPVTQRSGPKQVIDTLCVRVHYSNMAAALTAHPT